MWSSVPALVAYVAFLAFLAAVIPKTNRRDKVAIYASGLGIGILAGLSISPVIGIVISALMAVSMGLVTIGNKLKVKLWPSSGSSETRSIDVEFSDPVTAEVAFLVVGIVVGGAAGILMRTHAVFSPTSSKQAAGLGVPGQNAVPRRDESGQGAGVRDPAKEAAFPGFFASSSKPCAPVTDEVTVDALYDRLRARGERFAQLPANLSKDDLLALIQAFECSTRPLTQDQYDKFDRNPGTAEGHEHALLAQLYDEISDEETLRQVVKALLKPPSADGTED